jgi:multimeric flavodoxin WrbA
MGALIISGSPRKNGNTETLLWMLESELRKNGISTEFISLSGKSIGHCFHCDNCAGINQCIQKDDFNSIYDRMLHHEGLVVGSPVYVGAPSSLIAGAASKSGLCFFQ